MAIATIIPRQYVVDGIHQVIVATGSGLDYGDPRRCMWDEDVEQAVTLARNETQGVSGEVEDSPSVSGLDREDLGVHSRSSDVLALEYLTHRGIGEDSVNGPCQDRPDGEHRDLVEGERFGGNGERVRDHELIDRRIFDPLNRRR